MTRPIAALAAALAARAALADPLPEQGYGMPRDVSLDGHHVDWLIHFTLIASAIIFVVVLAALLWAALVHRRAGAALHSHGSRRSILVVFGSMLGIFALVDGNLFTRTVIDLHRHFWNFAAAEATPGAVRVEVNAHQWSWTFRLPGPDGRFNTPEDVVTTDDLRVPVGVPVVLQLASTDVIHSLYLPNFRVKQDAVPGNVGRLTFQARVPGEYEIGCAQHCGPNHYKMRAVLKVVTPEQYREWLETARADARRAWDPNDEQAHWGWEWRRF